MSRSKQSGVGKRRTREHIIANLAVNHVERQVLRVGYTMQRIANDYGLDEIVRTFNKNGEVENGLNWLQVKATDHPQKRKSGAVIAVRLEHRDVIHWMAEPYPVIVIVYDATADKAYWVCMQRVFQGGGVFNLAKSGDRLIVHVPLEQIVHEEAIREFRRLKIDAEIAWQERGRNHV